ncbi:MAG: DUF362 domain-containing protein [Acidobacteria bacterium]|nr:DUF362 domain-containing protein [Acidobacteriota bacterium]
MQRRRFLSLGLAASLAAAQQKPTQKEEAVTAGATADESPRVGIVRSDFTGSEDHDGTQIPGLADLQPTDKELTDAQLEAMVRKALEIGSPRQGGLPSLVAPDDWVVIKPNIETCHGLGPETRDGGAHHPYIHGSVTDPRIVRTLIAFLLQNKCGRRFTIAEGSGQWLPKEKSKSLVDGWSTDWGGAYGGWSYRKMVEDFSVRYPGIRFELVDLNFDETVELPVPEGGLAKNNPGGTYHIPKTIQQCDRLISVAPLQTHSRTGAALSITNYLGIGPGSKYGFPKEGLHKLGTLDEVAVDLFSYHPAEYAILGGMWGLEGDGPHAPGARSVRFNVIIAGANAVAVDAVGAAMMGLDLGRIQHLRLAERKGYGGWDLPLIWTRGNDVDESHRVFRPPAGWAAKG